MASEVTCSQVTPHAIYAGNDAVIVKVFLKAKQLTQVNLFNLIGCISGNSVMIRSAVTRYFGRDKM